MNCPTPQAERQDRRDKQRPEAKTKTAELPHWDILSLQLKLKGNLSRDL